MSQRQKTELWTVVQCVCHLWTFIFSFCFKVWAASMRRPGHYFRWKWNFDFKINHQCIQPSSNASWHPQLLIHNFLLAFSFWEMLELKERGRRKGKTETARWWWLPIALPSDSVQEIEHTVCMCTWHLPLTSEVDYLVVKMHIHKKLYGNTNLILCSKVHTK